MLEFLLLLPLIMISILSMTFEVSVDELKNASRGNYFKYDAAKNDLRSHEDRVIFLSRVLGSDPECTTVAIEKHLRCRCSCTTTEEECTSNQKFNPSTCRCECHGSEKENECRRSGKIWDPATCECICPSDLQQLCSTGAFFHPELCRCIQIDKSDMNRRRRPPV